MEELASSHFLARRKANVGKLLLPTFNILGLGSILKLSRIVNAGKFQCFKCDLTNTSDL